MAINEKELKYLGFLEFLNTSTDIEPLLKNSLPLILEIFECNRIQIHTLKPGINQCSVSHEYFYGNLDSMVGKRIELPSDTKEETIEQCIIYESSNFIGAQYNLNETTKCLIALLYETKKKQFSNEDKILLAKLTNHFGATIKRISELSHLLSCFESLQNQNKNLRRIDTSRKTLITNISHELKTPLSSILGFSSMLGNKTLNPELVKEITEQIQIAANRLSLIVNDFLQIDKITQEGWTVNNEKCNLASIIKNSVEEFEKLNKNYNFALKLPKDYPYITSDPKLIRQILDNLIFNAIKYSPENTTIEIGLKTITENQTIEISVKDHGYGISKDEKEKVFNRFFRSPNPNIQKVPGSGLGLSICQEILKSLNGEFFIESELNKGSKFTFRLPVN